MHTTLRTNKPLRENLRDFSQCQQSFFFAYPFFLFRMSTDSTDLTPLQIQFYKTKLMTNIVANIHENTKAKLFGGAVRDMILRKHQIEATDTKEQDAVMPNDLDFFTTCENDHKELITFVESSFGVKGLTLDLSNYPENVYTVHHVRIPILTMISPKHLCVELDLVLIRHGNHQRCDYDVNSLIMDSDGLVFETNTLEIVEHIKAQTAYLLPQEKYDDEKEDDQLLLEKLKSRSLQLLRKKWTLVTCFGTFKQTDTTTSCKLCKRARPPIISWSKASEIPNYLCRDCFETQFARFLLLAQKDGEAVRRQFGVFHL